MTWMELNDFRMQLKYYYSIKYWPMGVRILFMRSNSPPRKKWAVMSGTQQKSPL